MTVGGTLLGPFMRHALLGSVAVTALLASTNLGSAAQAIDWSGLYGGFSLGGEHLGTVEADDGTTTDTLSFTGLSGAGDIGYDWRSGDYVYGIGADVGITSAGSSVSKGASATPYMTLRGRVGMVINDTTLLYGTAGLAGAEVVVTDTDSDYRFSGFQPGFVAGAGAEFALTGKMSLQVEVRDTQYAAHTIIDGDHYTTQANSAIGLVGLQFHM